MNYIDREANSYRNVRVKLTTLLSNNGYNPDT